MPGLLFTDSELSALHRLRGLVLPRFVTESDADDVRVDVIALRGLAARELVALESGEVCFSPALSHVLAPCDSASLIAEVDIEQDGSLSRSGLVSTADGRSVVFVERPWSLLAVSRAAGSVIDLLEQLCQLDAVDGGKGQTMTVPSRSYLRADDLLASGSPDAAVDLLVSAGASLGAAHAWLGAVTDRLMTVMVRVARSRGAGSFHAVELAWLVAGDGTGWQISTADVEPADWEDAEPETATTLRQVDAAVLRDALADVCDLEIDR